MVAKKSYCRDFLCTGLYLQIFKMKFNLFIHTRFIQHIPKTSSTSTGKEIILFKNMPRIKTRFEPRGEMLFFNFQFYFTGVAAMNVFLGLNGSAEELGVKRQNCWAFSTNNIDKDALDYFDLDVEKVISNDDIIISRFYTYSSIGPRCRSSIVVCIISISQGPRVEQSQR